MGLSTHVLDTSHGRPVPGLIVHLARENNNTWQTLTSATTDADGRSKSLLPADALEPGAYRLRFETAAYFRAQTQRSLYPFVDIVFLIDDPTQHFHIPLLLTANGYTTYRGS